MYPSGSTTLFAENEIIFPNGTTLVVSIPVPNASGICLSSIPNPPASHTTISLEGHPFNKEESTGGSEKWIAYTSEYCLVSMAFKLSSTSPSAADLKLLETIVGTVDTP